ncbi:MAG: hypothetical protein DHS20C09_10310 [marine bacterium B5-7]|nr:MAG: hypothetical protein DHS20C09_10310 [marine bacterium B5-7]
MTGQTSFSVPYWLLSQAEDTKTGFIVSLAANPVNDIAKKIVQKCLAENNIVIDSTNTSLGNEGIVFCVSMTSQRAWDVFQKLLLLLANVDTDVFVLPEAARQKQLLICDMDSTIVQTETLDDIAESIGIGAQVSEITARAMQGKLDFRKALDERVSLLKGIPEKIFDEIAQEVRFNSGAELLIESAQKRGIRTVLVSGGFEPIVKVVAAKLGFDRYVCNKTEITEGRLTGKVLNPVVDAETKLSVLKEEAKQLTIELEQACTLGDGANDLPMLKAAGLGVGYKAKPLVRAGTPYQINFSSLTSVLLMMGITPP